eukprot:gene3120-44809_t
MVASKGIHVLCTEHWANGSRTGLERPQRRAPRQCSPPGPCVAMDAAARDAEQAEGKHVVDPVAGSGGESPDRVSDDSCELAVRRK